MVKFSKAIVVVSALAAVVVVACAGPGGKGEGDSCSDEDQCSVDLTCQPIAGHGDVCCPAPPDASTKAGCHASPDGG